MSKYSNNVIYKIVCKDLTVKDVYVGHTTNFIGRNRQHKDNLVSSQYKVYQVIRSNGGWNNWEMIEIEKFPCQDKNEAKARERYFYEILNSTLNTCIPVITEEERKEYEYKYQQEYRETNKEEIKTQRKSFRDNNVEKLKTKKQEYYEAHKEEEKEKMKKYYNSNKEKFILYRSQDFVCDCGSTVKIFHKQRHLSSLKHQNFIKK